MFWSATNAFQISTCPVFAIAWQSASPGAGNFLPLFKFSFYCKWIKKSRNISAPGFSIDFQNLFSELHTIYMVSQEAPHARAFVNSCDNCNLTNTSRCGSRALIDFQKLFAELHTILIALFPLFSKKVSPFCRRSRNKCSADYQCAYPTHVACFYFRNVQFLRHNLAETAYILNALRDKL
jgi:hypothetical protein